MDPLKGFRSDRGYEADGEILCRKPPDKVFWLGLDINRNIKLHSVVWDVFNSTYGGLESDHYPIRSMEGTGGTYFMQDPLGQKYVSVFKPIDEEPNAVNNPQGRTLSRDGEGLKKGTRVGEGAFRELAAYVLDHPKGGPRSLFGEGKGFAGVPPTFMVKCLHRRFNHPGHLTVKTGSLQMFMENNGSCEEIGPGEFLVEAVHRISVLDIRLANADRHAGNILLSKEQVDGKTLLIPIDHGYCLPETFEDCTFEWLNWPQAHQPYSTETIDYIRTLDAEEDISLLKFHGWDVPLECARTLRISTMLLKKGVERGLDPFAIGSMICRENGKESVIEEIVQKAQNPSEATFLENVSRIMDHHLDKNAPFPFP